MRNMAEAGASRRRLAQAHIAEHARAEELEDERPGEAQRQIPRLLGVKQPRIPSLPASERGAPQRPLLGHAAAGHGSVSEIGENAQLERLARLAVGGSEFRLGMNAIG